MPTRIDARHKGCPPRVTSIAIVNDDELDREALLCAVQQKFPKLDRVRAYESIFECYQGWLRFDYVIIDISAVAPFMMGDVARAYSPIARFMCEYTGTEVIITSAMGRESTNEVIDSIVFAGVERSRVHYGGQTIQAVLDELDRLIKPEDMEWTHVQRRAKN